MPEGTPCRTNPIRTVGEQKVGAGVFAKFHYERSGQIEQLTTMPCWFELENQFQFPFRVDI